MLQRKDLQKSLANNNKNTRTFGASLSHRQCEAFHVKWEDCVDLAKELNLQILRIPVYWNELQPEINSKVSLKPLKKQLDYLVKKEINVCLQIGIKSLWWPEFYFPEGTSHKEFFSNESHQKIFFDYLGKLLELSSKYSNITHIQVENEPFNASGPEKSKIPEEFLDREIKLVRESSDKIILSSVWLPTFTQQPLRTINNINELDQIGIHYYYDFPNNKLNITDQYTRQLFKFQLKLNKSLRNKIIISELQAMPWRSEIIRADYSPPDWYAKKLKQVINLPINEFWLWGLEFWEFRRKHYDDASWVEKFSSILVL